MAGVDKVDVPVGGRPLLAWTLEAIAAAPSVGRIVLVTAAAKVGLLAGAAWLPASVTAVVAGGPRRQESVAAGVAALADGPPGAAILVHDGARPLVSAALVERVVAAVAAHGAAIPVLPVAETLKRLDGDAVGGTVDRAGLATAQTPQGIRRDLLTRAYATFPPDGPVTFTDEAALLEACRIDVHAIPGEPANLKVTLPDDLARVEVALAARRAVLGGRVPAAIDRRSDRHDIRIGFGDDTHPFGPGGPLALGGISIDGAPRLHGHSDGDVALHALCDAMLGAAGLGDLGRVFPAGPATPPGIASPLLVEACLARVRAAGLRPAAVDLTIVGARPRLAARLPEMAAAISGLLDLPIDRVNIKASTGNLAGWEGAGRGIAARSVALLTPEDGA